jgi:hypothetical protein
MRLPPCDSKNMSPSVLPGALHGDLAGAAGDDVWWQAAQLWAL